MSVRQLPGPVHVRQSVRGSQCDAGERQKKQQKGTLTFTRTKFESGSKPPEISMPSTLLFNRCTKLLPGRTKKPSTPAVAPRRRRKRAFAVMFKRGTSMMQLNY